MKKILLILTLTAVSLNAADATGKWIGTLNVLRDGGTAERPAFLVLKQDGAKLTGTVGPNAGEQFEIREGKVENGRLIFEVPSEAMKFDLKQAGDEITGDVTRDHDGETQRAKLSVKREN